MVLSTEKLLKSLQSRDTNTTDLYTTLNTLLAKKIEIQSSPIANFRLCSTLLSVLCMESKWVLMDSQVKHTCSELLASNVGLEMIVRNLRNGVDNLSNSNSNSEINQLPFDIKTGLTLSGTSYIPLKSKIDIADNGIKTKGEFGTDPDLIIEKQSTTKFSEPLANHEPHDLGGASLYLPLNKETIAIQFDILFSILNNHLNSLVINFLDTTNVNTASFKDFKSLLSIKVNEVLGQGLVHLLDNPNSLSVGSLGITRDQFKSTVESYSINLIISLLKYGKPSFIVLEILCELLRRDNSVWMTILSNWQSLLDSIPSLGTSARKDPNQMKTIKLMTSQLFQFQSIPIAQAAFWQVLVSSWIKKLKEIGVSMKIYHEFVYNLCEESINYINSFIWLESINYVNVEWVKRSINKFGTKEYISNVPLKNQNLYTIHIIFMCDKLDDSKIDEISKNKLFLNAITHRLESKVDEIRQLGMILADIIYERENNKPLFTVSGFDNKRKQFVLPIEQFKNVELNKGDISLDSAIDVILNNGKSVSLIESDDKIIEREQPLVMELDYDSDADDSDLEDTSVPRRPTVNKPVYLKDLLEYLTCETENDKKTYYKRGISFSIGIEMVRLKRNTTELSFYTSKLLDAVSNINDFGFPDLPKDIKSNTSRAEAFNIWKISFIIAVIVSSPVVGFQHLFTCFLQNDISTPQRVQILSAIGFSCRELCGHGDDDVFIWGKDNDEKVQPKTLSGAGHQEFKKLDAKIMEVSNEDEGMSKTIEGNEYISSGTVIRKSKKLEIDKNTSMNASQLQKKHIVTSYINRELPKVFYSLTTIWHEVNSQTGGRGFIVGNMSEILNSHYLSILSMVFKCAVPSCIDVVEMSREMLTIVREQLLLLDTNKDFQPLMFVSVVKCAGGLILNNENVIKILLNSQVMEILDVLNILTTLMNENGDTITDIVSLSIAAKVVLVLQGLLKGNV